MPILLTGGAGFIGRHFVLDWVARCDELIVNLVNLVNLNSLQGDQRYFFFGAT